MYTENNSDDEVDLNPEDRQADASDKGNDQTIDDTAEAKTEEGIQII